MSYALNNVATQDAYAEATTLKCVGAVRVNIEIRQAAIYYQMTAPDPGMPEDAWGYGPEVYASRTLRSLNRRTSAIRVRSAVAGTPATVTIEAMRPIDVG